MQNWITFGFEKNRNNIVSSKNVRLSKYGFKIQREFPGNIFFVSHQSFEVTNVKIQMTGTNTVECTRIIKKRAFDLEPESGF